MTTTAKFKKRFWSKVKKTPTCWVWIGSKKGLYGSLGHRGTLITSHRTSFIMKYGAIPEGLCVCHKCDNPPCVRPSHLWAGTNIENTRDRTLKRRDLRGEDNKGGGKLLWADVREIRRIWVPYVYSKRRLAKKYGVSQQMIKNILSHKNWKENAGVRYSKG